MDEILMPISPGELLDKLTILQIKAENITDPKKITNIEFERAILQSLVDKHISRTKELNALISSLLAANKQLWDIENDIRDCEKRNDFSGAFIQLARSVYSTNDRRADLKKQINLQTGSTLIEEKSYTDY